MKANIRFLTLICVLVLVLSACGGNTSQPAAVDSPGQTLGDGLSDGNFEPSTESNSFGDEIPESDASLPAAFGPSIASGSSNDVHWEIYENGLLVVTGSGDWDHAASSYYGPWIHDANKVVAAEVHLTGTTDANGMFQGCSNLSTVDLSDFDTSNVTSMLNMFNGCYSLTSLDLRAMDTGNVTDMACMFEKCASLTSLDFSSFDTSNVTSMSRMFFDCGVQALDLSNFDTHNVTNMGDMFYGCYNLTKLNVSSFDTSSVQFLGGMFQDCANLKELDVGGFDTSSSKDFCRVFCRCSSLEYLDLSQFNFGKNKVGNRDLIEDCTGLKEIKAPVDFGNKDFYIPLPGTFYDVDSGVECTRITQANAGHTLERK